MKKNSSKLKIVIFFGIFQSHPSSRLSSGSSCSPCSSSSSSGRSPPTENMYECIDQDASQVLIIIQRFIIPICSSSLEQRFLNSGTRESKTIQLKKRDVQFEKKVFSYTGSTILWKTFIIRGIGKVLKVQKRPNKHNLVRIFKLFSNFSLYLT